MSASEKMEKLRVSLTEIHFSLLAVQQYAIRELVLVSSKVYYSLPTAVKSCFTCENSPVPLNLN